MSQSPKQPNSSSPPAPNAPYAEHRGRAERAFGELFSVMATLRGPDGCPWDAKQTLQSLRSYLLEESHELVDAIDRLDDTGGGSKAEVHSHKSELGDLVFQVLFQSQIQMEAARFDVADVCDAMRDKLVFRHPHVFGTAAERSRPAPDWEMLKAKERALQKEQGILLDDDDGHSGALSGIPTSLPALVRAMRMGQRAHRVGFDWPDHKGVLAKIHEELAEIEEAFDAHVDDEDARQQRVGEEIGDLLYAIVNLCRHADVDPEACLAGTVRKFEHRFRHVERGLADQGKEPEDATLDEMEALWAAAKNLE